MSASYVNEGATCLTCTYQEGALKKEIDAIRQCKKCMKRNGRPGWHPKPTVKVEFCQAMDRRSKPYTIRRVIG